MRCLLALLWAAWAAGLPPAPTPSEPLLVSAAVSLSEAVEEIGKAWRAQGGGDVRFNFGPSNALARQIVRGAPVDVFVSADDAQMDVVDRAELLAPGSRVAVIGNRLAVAARPELVDAVRAAFPNAGPEIRRLALGDPSAVPAGVYARQYLERIGLWSAFERRVVPTASVRAALAAVANGAADAAIVYASDVHASPRVAAARVIPIADGPRIVYPGAVVRASRQPDAARRFVAFLRSPEAAAVFARSGFTTLETR
jgi:molybdate transport system substrate-binding protein